MLKTEDIAGALTPEEAAEHRRLIKLMQMARSPEPLTVAQIAELSGCSEANIYNIQQDALRKIKNNFPQLKKELIKQ